MTLVEAEQRALFVACWEVVTDWLAIVVVT